MATMYVKPGVRASVTVAELGLVIPLVPGKPFDSSDPTVREHPWAFTKEQPVIRVAPVEQATAGPGEMRDTRRP